MYIFRFKKRKNVEGNLHQEINDNATGHRCNQSMTIANHKNIEHQEVSFHLYTCQSLSKLFFCFSLFSLSRLAGGRAGAGVALPCRPSRPVPEVAAPSCDQSSDQVTRGQPHCRSILKCCAFIRIIIKIIEYSYVLLSVES